LAAQIRALADLFPEPERIRTRPPAGAGTPEQQAALDRAERACAAAGTTLDALDPAERQELLGAAAAAAHDPARWEAMCREHEAARRATQTSTASDPAPPEAARQQPAQTTPALPRGTGAQMLDGEIHTQADWGDQSGELGELLGALTRADENVLRCLRARECGRTQVELSKQWADHTAAVMTRWRGRVTGVNARQDPVVGAIQSAGGPEETARKGYYDEM